MDFREIGALDESKESGGVWVDWRGGVRLKVASASQPEFQSHCRKLLKPHERDERAGKLGMRDRLLILAPAIERWLLKDWSGVSEGDDAIPYSLEKAREYLRDPAFHPLREFVFASAGDQESYLEGQLEESVGN